jgi:hypothetical protein
MSDNHLKPYRGALYRSTGSNFLMVLGRQDPADDDRPLNGYTRVSEFIEIDFPPLPAAEVVSAEIRSLDEARAKIVETFTAQLAAIDGRKAELMAVTHQVSE